MIGNQHSSNEPVQISSVRGPQPCDVQMPLAYSSSPYNIIDTESDEIRLIEICPGIFEDPIEINLHTASLKECPEYNALSYVWAPRYGMSGKPTSPVTVKNFQNHPILVGENLDAAIRHLRLTDKPITMWIDALSINQNNIRERNHQVGIMSKIYSLAKDVIIWLGAAKDDSDFVMKTIASSELVETDIRRFLDGLQWVLSRDWFSRMWIAQELTLARRDPIVLCGHRSVMWQTFAFTTLLVRAKTLDESEGLISTDLPNLRDIPGLDLEGWRVFWLTKSHWIYDSPSAQAIVARAEAVQNLLDIRMFGPKTPFSEQLRHTIYLCSTDPRDRVFGLLGISRFDHCNFDADYTKSLRMLYSETMVVVLKESFHDAYSWLKLHHSSIPGLPSWVPDLQIQASMVSQSPRALVPQANTIESTIEAARGFGPWWVPSKDCRSLYTVGIRLGKVKYSKPLNSSDAMETNYTSTLPLFRKAADEHDFSASALLSALLGPSNPHAPEFEFEKLLAAFRVACGYPTTHETVAVQTEAERADLKINKVNWSIEDKQEEQNRQDQQQLLRALRYSAGNYLFITDTGRIGLCNEDPSLISNEDKHSCILVGLFGINFPFILKKAVNQTAQVRDYRYEMLSVAHVANHRWGHKFVEQAPSDTRWREFVKYGLKRFEII